ncbi:MAG: glutathione peroxidase [Bacteriovoracaceae bacterium]
MTQLYDFKATLNNGEEVSIEKFKGKYLLIVNTASKCGFTPQYKVLEELYQNQKENLEILAFPCNQFGAQEPGSDDEIQSFCELNYGVTFPLFQKVDVNGDSAHPLFQYAKSALPGLLGSEKIKWNFTKFLFSPEGKPLKRYAPKDNPKKIEQDLS